MMDCAHSHRMESSRYPIQLSLPKVLVAGPAVSWPMDQPRVAVERDDDRLALREQAVEVYSAEIWSPFSATERFMNSTGNPDDPAASTLTTQVNASAREASVTIPPRRRATVRVDGVGGGTE
jgi:hypothetical protein